jgi:hypothetical protein
MEGKKSTKEWYQEKLKDPRWQKVRLKVLERENWTCEMCKDKETEFQIHHESYHGNPWDAPMEKLRAYCKHCHQFIEYVRADTKFKAVILSVHKSPVRSGGANIIFKCKYPDGWCGIGIVRIYEKEGPELVFGGEFGEIMNGIEKLKNG